MTQDNLLAQFSRGFKGPRDETGLLDAGPPKAWIDAWYKLQSKEHKQTGVATIEGYTCQFDSETGNLTIVSPMPHVQLSPNGHRELIAFIYRGPAPENVQPQINPGGQASAPDNPIQRQRMERNLKAMEQWAKASSKAFPTSK